MNTSHAANQAMVTIYVLWILQIHPAIEKQRRSPGLSQELPLHVYKGKETNQMVCLIYTKPGTGGKCISRRVSRSIIGESETDLYYYTPDLSLLSPNGGQSPARGFSGAVNTPAGRSKVGEHAGLGGSRLDSTTVEKSRISETM
jgi:hypothetical protein